MRHLMLNYNSHGPKEHARLPNLLQTNHQVVFPFQHLEIKESSSNFLTYLSPPKKESILKNFRCFVVKKKSQGVTDTSTQAKSCTNAPEIIRPDLGFLCFFRWNDPNGSLCLLLEKPVPKCRKITHELEM